MPIKLPALPIFDAIASPIKCGFAATPKLLQTIITIGVNNRHTISLIAIADKKEIPVIASVATNDQLTAKREFANRVCFTDSFQGEVVANFAKVQGYKTAVVVVDQAQVYSLGLAKAFEQAFKKNGGEIVKKVPEAELLNVLKEELDNWGN